jgi:hypothetical protein
MEGATMKRWIVLGLVVSACGSSNGGGGNPGGSITGTVAGHSLDVKDAVFGIDPTTKLVWVYVGDRTGLCNLLAATTLPGTTSALALVLANVTGVGSTGDYTVGDYTWLDLANNPSLPPAGRYWAGSFAVASDCTTATNTDATAGTLTVTQVGNSTGTHLKATLNNLKFGTDTLNGSFEASSCAAAVNPTCGGSLLARPPAPRE